MKPSVAVPRVRPTRWSVILTVLAVLGAVTRLTELGYPTDEGTPVFDEKHYVPQS